MNTTKPGPSTDPNTPPPKGPTPLEQANTIIARLEAKYPGLRCPKILDNERIEWAQANAWGLMNRHQRRAAWAMMRRGKR